MNELVYSFRDNNVRVVEIDNVVWFVSKDVCEVLEISNPSQALTRLDEDEKNTIILNEGIGNPNKTVINESGLYSLILGSRKSEAKEFKRWVTKEVLPSIRKHGMYATDDVLQKTIDDPDFMIGLLNKLKEEKEQRQKAEKTVNILTHVNKTYTATEIAKELGMNSANQLNKILHEKGIQYSSNGTWVLYTKYSRLGYVHIKQEVKDNGRVIYHRKWTQLGREFLINLLQEV